MSARSYCAFVRINKIKVTFSLIVLCSQLSFEFFLDELSFMFPYILPRFFLTINLELLFQYKLGIIHFYISVSYCCEAFRVINDMMLISSYA